MRLAGGLGNDTIKGGPEDDLIEAGFGADKLYGGAGSDGLIGSTPGPTFLYGEGNGDLMAAGSGCAGGRIVGGPGRDDASFAETQAHPGILYISFPKGKAWVDEIRGCNPVRLAESNEDMEGSFDNDILIGDGSKNSMLGQPGVDRIYGNGGDDVIDARDSVRDEVVQCSPGSPTITGADLRGEGGAQRPRLHRLRRSLAGRLRRDHPRDADRRPPQVGQQRPPPRHLQQRAGARHAISLGR